MLASPSLCSRGTGAISATRTPGPTLHEINGFGRRYRGRRAIVLASHSAQFHRSGIAKFAARVWLVDTSKNTSKADGCSGLLLVFSIPHDNYPRKSGIEPAA
jgi:hypothetical protein